MVLPLHRPGGGLRSVCAHEACDYVQRRHLRRILGCAAIQMFFWFVGFRLQYDLPENIIGVTEQHRINFPHLHHRRSAADHRKFHGKQADADELHV